VRQALLAAGVLLAGCRTELRPLVQPQETPARRAAGGGCAVRDYPSATDIAAGATHLGWVAVPRTGTDEEAFIALRAAVCAKGGNAFSQAHWNRAAGASVADAPVELEANAWIEP
jgi:hypothetical protein